MQPTYLPPPPPKRTGLLSLVADLMQRRGGRRALTGLTAVLVVAGVALFAYPAVTDLWAHHRQAQLDQQFRNPSYEQAYLDGDIGIGEGLTELEIPVIRVNVLVVQGTTTAALRAGAGHYVNTPLPGQRGNVGIAGHRTTFGRPFNRLDRMRVGDQVILITPFARYTYAVVPAFDGHPNPWVVEPDDISVVSQAGALGAGHWLTLTTCNPKGSAAQRLILRLTLVSSQKLTSGSKPDLARRSRR